MQILKSFPLLSPPIINASGILSYPEVFETFENQGASIGGYVTKSIGPSEKKGNENPVIIYSDSSGGPTLNSLALPTQDLDDWIEELSKIKLKKSLLISSIYAGNPKEFAFVAEKISPFSDIIEINLGCPNKEPGEKTIMESIGQNPTLSGEITSMVRDSTDKPIVAKLSPNSDYLSVAEKCLESGADGLGCANTLGPGLSIDIKTKEVILAGTSGGISGQALKPINLLMTFEAFARFSCPIIAYGGIATWEDGVEYLLAGASVLGLGTVFLGKSTKESIKTTQEIWQGIESYLNGDDIEKLIGKAHKHTQELK
jgi:dihydroorotate dehydrogenase (NAD+) catalytic subunit